MNKNRRILVIDDNPSIHKDFRNILAPKHEEDGHLENMEAALFGEKTDKAPVVEFEVDCASQGQEGYAKVIEAAKAGRPYATAFVDVRMPPGWDGIETVERIWAEYRDLQVVICTAYSDYSWDKIMKRLGHSDQLLILKKPFDNIEVMQVALALTEKWHLTAQARAHIEEVEKKVVERTRELQEFAYGVSHDLQEPLRKVMAFGDRLREKCQGQLDEDGLDYLKRMQDAAGRMRNLINDLLALSRVTTQAKPSVQVNLNTLAAEVLSDLEILVEKVGGKVNVGPLPTIMADPTQMRQLFQNLIGNALKFRKKDVAPVIRIEAEAQPETASAEKTGRIWQFKFQDNGIGFDAKYREKIFEVFQRLHSRSEYEGSGIGLSLCRKIVSRHGGSIAAESVQGEGATFIICLPERHGEAPSDAAKADAATPKAQPATTETSTTPAPEKSAIIEKPVPAELV
ncbi:MAG: ATP-binding protein [Verrucomicrobiota bacterium]